MSISRAIPLSLHGAVEMFAAPAIMFVPLLLGHALSLFGAHRPIPLSAHAEFDYVLAGAAILSGLGVAIAGNGLAAIFLVGVGAAQMALTASTRFSVPRGI